MHPEPITLFAPVCVDRPGLARSLLFDRPDEAAAEAARQRDATGAAWVVVRVTVAEEGRFW